MTPPNVIAFVALCVALAAGAVLWIGYHEQHVEVAKQEVRVMERDRDYGVLTKRLEEMRLRLEMNELERDALKAKVVELQQKQDEAPFQIRQLRAEVQAADKSRAHLALENLALIAREKKWAVRIVIWFVDYADREMADEMKKFLHAYDPSWSISTRYDSDDTSRPKMAPSRIEVGSNKETSEFAGRLTWGLAMGRYCNDRVHHVAGEADAEAVIVTIFPKSKSETETRAGEPLNG